MTNNKTPASYIPWFIFVSIFISTLTFGPICIGAGGIEDEKEYNFTPHENRLKTVADPLPSAGLDKEFCEDFVYAHRKYCTEPEYDPKVSEQLAQFLVDNTDYISDDVLFEKMRTELKILFASTMPATAGIN